MSMISTDVVVARSVKFVLIVQTLQLKLYTGTCTGTCSNVHLNDIPPACICNEQQPRSGRVKDPHALLRHTTPFSRSMLTDYGHAIFLLVNGQIMRPLLYHSMRTVYSFLIRRCQRL